MLVAGKLRAPPSPARLVERPRVEGLIAAMVERYPALFVIATAGAGKTTALVYNGGTEQRGPQNVNGGHTLMGRATVKAIALKLENAIAAVQLATELAGNHGLSRHNKLERHLRDVLCARIHTPQPDAAWTAAGRIALA